MQRFFISRGAGKAGNLRAACYGPFTSMDDVQTFLSQAAPPGDYFIFEGASQPQLQRVAPRVVTTVPLPAAE